jgi:hypothetical protein
MKINLDKYLRLPCDKDTIERLFKDNTLVSTQVIEKLASVYVSVLPHTSADSH